tara:strand:- start:166 stop:537 length:372 start_codon:yes stop_codon:yes gene_type:complete
VCQPGFTYIFHDIDVSSGQLNRLWIKTQGFNMTELTCFKAYDIRGRLGDELNTDVAYRIGRAYAQYLNARRVVVGGDVRATSNELKEALAQGMMDAGCDVVDLGMTGTEQVYFASFHLDVDGP